MLTATGHPDTQWANKKKAGKVQKIREQIMTKLSVICINPLTDGSLSDSFDIVLWPIKFLRLIFHLDLYLIYSKTNGAQKYANSHHAFGVSWMIRPLFQSLSKEFAGCPHESCSAHGINWSLLAMKPGKCLFTNFLVRCAKCLICDRKSVHVVSDDCCGILGGRYPKLGYGILGGIFQTFAAGWQLQCK